MNIYLRKFLQRGGIYMKPVEDDDVGGNGTDNDLDTDDDLDSEIESHQTQTPAKKEVKLGEQEDGSVVVELDDEEGADEQKADGEQNEEGTDNGDAEEAERQKIREARRLERQERKQRQREKEESIKRELAAEREARKQLEQRLASLEGRDRSREIAGVEADMRNTANAYGAAKAEYQDAVSQNDGEAAAAALEKMQAARERFARLDTAKKAYEQQQKAPTPAVNPVLMGHAQKFMNEHKWFKQGGTDLDSMLLTQIDNSLAQEGWDPSTDAYWTELRARVKKYLPHRVASGKVSTNSGGDGKQDDKPAPARQNKAVVGGGGGESQGAGKGTFHLSPDRVRAMKDAGMWDDPVKRKEAIAAYRSYDKQHSKGN